MGHVYTRYVSTPPIVEFSNVGFSTSGTTILREIDLVVSPGDVVGISGDNGSGKTTLLRMLATLLQPTSGQWSTLGLTRESSRQDLVATRPQIALLGHTPAVWPELTLDENVLIVERLTGEAATPRPLAEVGLGGAADRRAASASLGMLRRVEFARVLRRLPRLLLLDEAHAGLDANAFNVVTEAVQRVQSVGGATVMVSHDPGRMADVTTRTARLVAGTLVKGSS